MAKYFLKKPGDKEAKKYSQEQVKQILSEKHACYVLITCSEPSEDGKMEVELSYDGDESLASYLLQSAQNIFDEQVDQSINSCQD